MPDTVNTASATRSWTLDTQGNWSQNPAGNTYAVNGQNQYTSISSAGSSSSSGSGSTLNFVYDNDGNMTTRVDSSGIGNANYTPDTLQFDAWDRLTRLVHSVPNGGNPFGWTEQDFDIDALGRRCQVVVTGNSICTSTPSNDLYYSTDFQVLEDDRSVALDGGTGTGWTRSQYIWSPTYVNDLVLRDRDTGHDNTFAERLYVQQDANHNVTSLTNASGTVSVQQRFVYDPYGSATVLNASWSSASDSYNWIYLFQGGRFDSYAGLYDFQRREYDPVLGRSVQQDPTGTQYVDGANLYQFVRSQPINFTDPSGLACGDQKIDWWKLLAEDPDVAQPLKIGLALLQVVGGTAEFLAGLGTVTTPFGVPLALHGLDQAIAGLKTLVSDDGAPAASTYTAQFIANSAAFVGADPKLAQKIGAWGDAGIGLLLMFGAARAASAAAPVGRSGAEMASETGYEFNMIENAGPLASVPRNPAANFAGGRYNAIALADDTVLFRAGEAGKPLGQWFARTPPQSVAQARIDLAIKPQWIDAKTGVLTGTSPIDTVYAVKIPKGTVVYEGPVASQGGVYLGGAQNQVFVQAPWNNPAVEVVGSDPLH